MPTRATTGTVRRGTASGYSVNIDTANGMYALPGVIAPGTPLQTTLTYTPFLALASVTHANRSRRHFE